MNEVIKRYYKGAIPVEDLDSLLEEYTDHLEDLFEVDLKSSEMNGRNTTLQTARDWMEGEQ